MMEKVTPSRIDEIISAEIPDIEVDKDLYDIVSKNMIHGPCGSLNNNSPCLSDGKCPKRYPKDLLAETITDVPGGTGKTFLISIILATIRSQNNIALDIASSDIAATLLNGGRTAHSALKLSLNMQVIETPTCNISKYSGMGKELRSCQLLIWDECTKAHKKSLEALNHTLKDLRGNDNSTSYTTFNTCR
ncbi:ATP-dependent DNA helicase [Trichonephila clavipes]|nr:ATP-dependent DNA helicase [Trichonephila clavipes]